MQSLRERQGRDGLLTSDCKDEPRLEYLYSVLNLSFQSFGLVFSLGMFHLTFGVSAKGFHAKVSHISCTHTLSFHVRSNTVIEDELC